MKSKKVTLTSLINDRILTGLQCIFPFDIYDIFYGQMRGYTENIDPKKYKKFVDNILYRMRKAGYVVKVEKWKFKSGAFVRCIQIIN